MFGPAVSGIARLVILGFTVSAGAAAADTASQPGLVVPEPATQTALAVRWPVTGDSNGNARVAVSYRRQGETTLQSGHNLFRPHPVHVSPENLVPGGRLFAGSIVGLQPGSRYEIKLILDDPDGGSAQRTLSLETQAEPALPANMRERFVRPRRPGETGGGGGTRGDPIRGIATAARIAEAGDLILLLPGVYSGSNIRTRDGAPGAQIAFRGVGEAIIDGGGNRRVFDIRGRSHLWFENLTLRNASILVDAGQANHIVLRANRFEVKTFGIRAHGAIYDQSRHIMVSDNSFDGGIAWPPSKPFPSVYAISLSGVGHVVRHNRIRRVRDGVFNGNDGKLSASDFHNNDIAQCADDGIETDHSDTNVRVFNNRVVDCFFGVSIQPAHGGPVYVYRNFIYNARSSPFKLHNRTSGVLIYHNTSVRRGFPFVIQPGGETVNDVVTRNNLFIGTGGPALGSTGRMVRSDFDNDGYAWTSGPFALWNGHTIPSIAAARGGQGPYSHHGAIGIGPESPFAGPLLPPSDRTAPTDTSALDPRLAADGAAVDRGVALRGFNGGFSGRAPDLGCCEAGAQVPHYGPR